MVNSAPSLNSSERQHVGARETPTLKSKRWRVPAVRWWETQRSGRVCGQTSAAGHVQRSLQLLRRHRRRNAPRCTACTVPDRRHGSVEERKSQAQLTALGGRASSTKTLAAPLNTAPRCSRRVPHAGCPAAARKRVPREGGTTVPQAQKLHTVHARKPLQAQRKNARRAGGKQHRARAPFWQLCAVRAAGKGKGAAVSS